MPKNNDGWGSGRLRILDEEIGDATIAEVGAWRVVCAFLPAFLVRDNPPRTALGFAKEAMEIVKLAKKTPLGVIFDKRFYVLEPSWRAGQLSAPSGSRKHFFSELVERRGEELGVIGAGDTIVCNYPILNEDFIEDGSSFGRIPWGVRYTSTIEQNTGVGSGVRRPGFAETTMLFALKDEKLSVTFSKVEAGRVVMKLNKE